MIEIADVAKEVTVPRPFDAMLYPPVVTCPTIRPPVVLRSTVSLKLLIPSRLPCADAVGKEPVVGNVVPLR